MLVKVVVVKVRVGDSDNVSHYHQLWQMLGLWLDLWLEVAIRVGVLQLGFGLGFET